MNAKFFADENQPGVSLGGSPESASGSLSVDPLHSPARAGGQAHRAHPSHSSPESHDPESDYALAQGEGAGRWELWLAWWLFHLLALPLWLRDGLRAWLRTKHICSWCKRRTSGNPFAKRISHGGCPACLEKWKRELDQASEKADR